MGGTVGSEYPRHRTTRVWRGGGSFVIALPVAYCKMLNIRRGDEVKVYVVGDVMCIQPARGETFVRHVVSVKPGRPAEEVTE